MRVYALYDESLADKKALAYIFYYSKTDEWYIEISEEVTSQWELPFILDHFFEQGYRTVDEYWSRKFVQQRIIPPDRQNLGAILKNCKLDVYDEFALFEIADGRCAQDDCYIERISEDSLPKEIINRRNSMLTTVIPVEKGSSYLVTQKDGTVGMLEIEDLKENDDQANRMLLYFNKLLELSAGCHGAQLSIQGGNAISYEVINANLQKLPLNVALLRDYAQKEIVSTSEAMEILGCSRQNLDDYVKRGRLEPTTIKGKNRTYFRSDVEKLLDGG